MIRIELQPEQRTQARSGAVVLTEGQVRSAWGKLTASLRGTRSGGRAPSCDCGTCRKCYLREKKRLSREAG
jgi:hypothetical protein